MSKIHRFRGLLGDFSVIKLWGVWTRYHVSSMVKKYTRERRVWQVLHSFRQTFLTPRRTFLISAAAYQNVDNNEDNSNVKENVQNNITDDELQMLLTDLDGIDELARNTIYCSTCNLRLVIDKKIDGINYCTCKISQKKGDYDGWLPYTEAEGVIIWRKEYKPGEGLYAYKVYGKYPEIKAKDFAAIQIDGTYRMKWDDAVASLKVVEQDANGVKDQDILHWEVLWPRLFTNRDYVYIRRHKSFEMNDQNQNTSNGNTDSNQSESIDSNARRKDRAYIILSKSCEHKSVPETKSAVRVTEYWSQMVVKSLQGADKPGMVFVLTYYDEPSVKKMPTGVAAWATGRAAPAYLNKMRQAAYMYQQQHEEEEQTEVPAEQVTTDVETQVDNTPDTKTDVNEEPSKEEKCPQLERKDQSTQTEDTDDKSKVVAVKMSHEQQYIKESTLEQNSDMTICNNNLEDSTWWHYMFPFYYYI